MYSEGTEFLVLQEGSGKLLWRNIGELEAVDADQIYLNLSHDATYFLGAFRATDGKHLWQVKVTGTTSVLSDTDGVVYLYNSIDGSLLALNARDGTERWNILLAFPPGTSAVDTRFDVAVQVSASVVYVHTSFGQISAYQEESGTLLWSQTFPESGGLIGYLPWQISAGVIYLTTRSHLYALRISDGQVLWQHEGQSTFVLYSASGIVSLLQANVSDATLIAVQAQTGQVLWQHAEPQLKGNTSPIGLQLIGGILYSGAWANDSIPAGMLTTYFQGTISAIRASDGLPLWQYQGKDSWDILEVEGTQTTAFLLSADYPATHVTALVTAVRVTDGTPLWQHSAPAAGLTLAGDALYTGYGGNGDTSSCLGTGVPHVMKYRATDGQNLWDVQPPSISEQ